MVIIVETGPAIESLEKLAEKKTKFDVIFMDANKEGYVPYYKAGFIIYGLLLLYNEFTSYI